jgi:hypothetical protein
MTPSWRTLHLLASSSEQGLEGSKDPLTTEAVRELAGKAGTSIQASDRTLGP